MPSRICGTSVHVVVRINKNSENVWVGQHSHSYRNCMQRPMALNCVIQSRMLEADTALVLLAARAFNSCKDPCSIPN